MESNNKMFASNNFVIFLELSYIYWLLRPWNKQLKALVDITLECRMPGFLKFNTPFLISDIWILCTLKKEIKEYILIKVYYSENV